MGNSQVPYVFTEKDIVILQKLTGKSKSDIQEWYNDFTKNCRNGYLEFDEFLTGYILTTDGSALDKIGYAFDVYDVNDNEVIEKKEARKIIRLLFKITNMSENDVENYTETVMLSFDIDRDKAISRKEFIDGCLNDSTLGKMISPFHVY
ncbi:unnamed protein product [Didymodactylos carnosus]|uniref:EF-hand domain-containing protein n=1 Tax=Didymodactylos carnosus TaxID=1234261 RepID=A0A814CKV1_9BILA|nr:unnamed protein product [Didymodactylos carnosus]CAF1231135.1 unnamed protein product [Didymodactylos carnosus]CAF3720949.1 unnamed protein product [Didymodactylos carnosus]CAF4039202.1 unnamed protein product [Didymodactylos carnosus]